MADRTGSESPAPQKGPGRWAWRARYRVWEANRKTFVYPENSLEPEQQEAKDDEAPAGKP
jgi:hypothetical protein